MEFETAKVAAERLGCTVRAVQQWASEGKLPGAKKQGRDWMIPTNAVKPSDFNLDEDISNIPYPILCSLVSFAVRFWRRLCLDHFL